MPVHPHGRQPERLGLPVALQRQQEREGGADQPVPARVPDQPVRHAVHAPCEFRGPAVVLAGFHQRREVLVGEDILDHRVAAVGGARIGRGRTFVGRSATVAAARGPGRRAGQADWIAGAAALFADLAAQGMRRSRHARACAGRLEEMRSSRRPWPSSPVASTTAPASPSPSLSSAAARAVRTISRHPGGISIGPVYASRSSR